MALFQMYKTLYRLLVQQRKCKTWNDTPLYMQFFIRRVIKLITVFFITSNGLQGFQESINLKNCQIRSHKIWTSTKQLAETEKNTHISKAQVLKLRY